MSPALIGYAVVSLRRLLSISVSSSRSRSSSSTRSPLRWEQSASHNNFIERFHGTLKQRTKVMRGMKNPDTARLLLDGWLMHYNYFRPHESLRGKTPAEAAQVGFPYKNWRDIVMDGLPRP